MFIKFQIESISTVCFYFFVFLFLFIFLLICSSLSFFLNYVHLNVEKQNVNIYRTNHWISITESEISIFVFGIKRMNFVFSVSIFHFILLKSNRNLKKKKLFLCHKSSKIITEILRRNIFWTKNENQILFFFEFTIWLFRRCSIQIFLLLSHEKTCFLPANYNSLFHKKSGKLLSMKRKIVFFLSLFHFKLIDNK